MIPVPLHLQFLIHYPSRFAELISVQGCTGFNPSFLSGQWVHTDSNREHTGYGPVALPLSYEPSKYSNQQLELQKLCSGEALTGTGGSSPPQFEHSGSSVIALNSSFPLNLNIGVEGTATHNSPRQASNNHARRRFC